MKSESIQVPALRFREFTTPWQSGKLGTLGTFFSGGTPPTGCSDYYNGNIPFIKSAEIGSSSTEQFLSELGLQNSSAKQVQPGDLLYALYGATSGEVAIAKIGGAINQAVLCIRTNLNTGYLYNYLQYKKDHITRTYLQGGQGNLSAEIVKNLRVPVTSISEQEKIAAFLSAMDEKIEQLARKKELLFKYKIGLLQQIFERKVRFKDDSGNDFPDWEERRFEEVFSLLPTNSFSREDLNYFDGDVQNIHYGDIHTKFRPLLNANAEKIPFINKDISLTKIPQANYLRTGDLVFADASEDYADVGKCIEIGSIDRQRILAGLHTLLARPKANALANGFGTYWMKSSAIRRQIMREAQGTKVLGISAGRLSKIKLFLPSISEQAKIASFISMFEMKIELVNCQLVATTAFKKGLLQQMFI